MDDGEPYLSPFLVADEYDRLSLVGMSPYHPRFHQEAVNKEQTHSPSMQAARQQFSSRRSTSSASRSEYSRAGPNRGMSTGNVTGQRYAKGIQQSRGSVPGSAMPGSSFASPMVPRNGRPASFHGTPGSLQPGTRACDDDRNFGVACPIMKFVKGTAENEKATIKPPAYHNDACSAVGIYASGESSVGAEAKGKVGAGTVV